LRIVIFRNVTFPIVTALLLAATASNAQLGEPALAKLDMLRVSPESAGALIYRGDTFAQHTPSVQLYRYERRVQSTPAGLVASHLTRDPTGRVVIAETSVVSSNYEVQRFDVTNQQVGLTGSVVVSQGGHHLEYELNNNGIASKASEDVSAPVVSGPSLFGFILKNWNALNAGTTIPVRMMVMKEKTTYGFDLKFEKSLNGQASFTITPTSFLVRLAVAPLRVVFDANTKAVVRYEGRVPPMENISGKLKDLDARVEYTPVASTYR
jgi:hypothetical protein